MTYPIQNQIPKITLIRLNGEIVCTGPAASGNSVGQMRLVHFYDVRLGTVDVTIKPEINNQGLDHEMDYVYTTTTTASTTFRPTETTEAIQLSYNLLIFYFTLI